MAGGHDQLWKDLIRTFSADFLRLVDQDLASRLDLTQLVLEPVEAFLDQPTGAERRMDLVGVATDGHGDEALIHVEIELRFRASVAPRIWIYNRLLGLRRRRPVHSFVLFLRGGPVGHEIQRFREKSFGRQVGGCDYVVFGLSRLQALVYLARSEPLAWAFAALMRPGGAGLGDRFALRRACFERIGSARKINDYERFLLFNCVATYLELSGGAAEEFAAQLAEHRNAEDEMRPITWEEKVEARGLAVGREQGLESGMREVLLRQLRQRFPGLSGRSIERVQAIRSTEELGSLAERLLTARSLEELGLA